MRCTIYLEPVRYSLFSQKKPYATLPKTAQVQAIEPFNIPLPFACAYACAVRSFVVRFMSPTSTPARPAQLIQPQQLTRSGHRRRPIDPICVIHRPPPVSAKDRDQTSAYQHFPHQCHAYADDRRSVASTWHRRHAIIPATMQRGQNFNRCSIDPDRMRAVCTIRTKTTTSARMEGLKIEVIDLPCACASKAAPSPPKRCPTIRENID